uniref:Outer shell protein n=1 Tax=Chinook aquareovirus TaxID=2587490 RepID=A0A5B9N2L6_9REOV|nr:MAG: outer shell protein [Chinook aquareovirus]
MGNVQSSVTNISVKGNGNRLSPNASFQASAAPTFSLNPGVLNPSGVLYTASGVSLGPVTAESLALFYDRNGEPLSYLSDATIDTLKKIVTYLDMFRPLFEDIGATCPPPKLEDFTTITSGFVGSSPYTAIDNPVTNGYFVSMTRMRLLTMKYNTLLSQVAAWNKDLKFAGALAPINLPIGSTEVSFDAWARYLADVLPSDNICVTNPDASLACGAKMYPALRVGDSAESSHFEAVGVIAGSVATPSEQSGSLADGAAHSGKLLGDVAAFTPDIVTASSPVPIAAFNVRPAPCTYHYNTLNPLYSDWVVDVPATTLDVTITHAGVTYHLNIGDDKGNLVIDLNACTSSNFSFDLGNVSLHTSYPESTVSLLLLKTTVPLQSVSTAGQISVLVLEVTTEKTSKLTRLAPDGTKRLKNLNLSWIFESEVLSAGAYVYLAPCMLQSSTTTMTYPTTVGGSLTITPIDNTVALLGGVRVTDVSPADLCGSLTEEEVEGAFPTHAAHLLEQKVNLCASVLSELDPSGVAITNTTVAHVAGVLALSPAQRLYMDRSGVRDWFQRGLRALNFLIGNPKALITKAAPILSDPKVWTQLATGVTEAVKTGNVMHAFTDTAKRLAGLRSVTAVKEELLSKMTKRYPPVP